MKCVYIGKDELVFGKIGEATLDAFGRYHFATPSGEDYYLEDNRNLVEVDCFIEKCNDWLHGLALTWESVNSPFTVAPSVFERIGFNEENWDEAMLWTKDGSWCKAIDSNGFAWVICYKTKTAMYALRLDQFLRESFHENPKDSDE